MLLQELKRGMKSKQSWRGNHLAKEEEDARTKRVMVASALKNSLKRTKDPSLKTPQPRNWKAMEEIQKREAQW